MRVVFDVDGCLIDSRRLIVEAYGHAGAGAPNDVLAYEGIDWLGALGHTPEQVAAIKAAKNAFYLRYLQRFGVSTLPPYEVARYLTSEGHTCFAYTGAPPGTIAALRSRLPGWPFYFAHDGITTPQRMERLRLMYGGGVYIDDQHRLVDLPDRWNFVHYVGQCTSELYREIMNDR